MLNKISFYAFKILYKPCTFAFARVKFPLPDLGQKIKQGTVKKLYVSEGEYVKQFQKIADVQSDKQFTEITAPEMGKIAKIHYKQTQVCKVGDLFLQIQTSQESDVAAGITKNETVNKNSLNIENQKTNIRNDEQILASPVVRMYAKSYKINLSDLKGTGKKGRILKQDLINYMQSSKQTKQPAKKAEQTTKQMGKHQEKGKPGQQKKVLMNPFQKGMQKTMTQANKVPHLYYDQKMDVTELESMREKLKLTGVKVTVMGILIKTFSLALNDHPRINSLYRADKDEFSYQIQSNHNISLAIDTTNGLVVPNIKNVQNLSIVQIQEKLSELKKLSDSARLTKNHLQGGTVCLSNIGTIAGISACPLVLYPQICIVAIGRVVQTPYYYGNKIVKKKFMTMSFGCDHRVVDGASVAKFSNSWKNILQNPYVALVKLR